MSRAFFRALREAALSPRPDGQGESGRPFPARAARRAAQAGKERKRFFRRPMNWAMEKSILAARGSPLRNKVREPAGSPTPFGVGLPGLILCRGQVRLPGECRLGKGFALPLAPIPVGGGCGRPRHPLGRAYPVLAGAVDWSGRIPSANWGEFHSPLAPDTPWGGLTQSWQVQLIGAAAGREGFGGFAQRT